jgi:hypothetical protein
MSKKSKTCEINDIIESSYTEADYSSGSKYYDEVDSHLYRNTYNNGFGGGGGGGGNPFSKISVAPAPAPESGPAPTRAYTPPSHTTITNSSNMFMKYTGNTNTNTNTTGDKSAATPNHNEIKNTEDEFPSLGGKKPIVTKTPAPMNFKKIVETKKPVEVQQQVVRPSSKPKHDDYYDRFKVYEEVKYYSEKTAKSKIYSNRYTDDEDMDDIDDMDNIDDYDNE